jgi:transcriptional regulator with XRE-family HTH domain
MNAVLAPTNANAAAAESPLARARLQRRLTEEEAARRAGIPEDEVRWLEEGRLYRFPSADHALLSLLLYASSLGITHDEAMALAGRPVPPRPLRTNPWPRIAAVLALLAAAAAVAAVLLAGGKSTETARTDAGAPARVVPTLPPPWSIHVRVLNGSGDIDHTRALASRIGALGYSIAKVGRANNFRYQQTVVYYPPGGKPIALRLAKRLGVDVAPLPGGRDPRLLVVIAGPKTLS